MSTLLSMGKFNNGLTPADILPSITVFLILLFFVYYISIVVPRQGTAEWISRKIHKDRLSLFAPRYSMDKKDILPFVVITLVFLSLAVFNLGGTATVDVIAHIQDPVPGQTHISNMYFDEVYFVRTAVEHIKNLNPYEITHPPLGKEIIAASILIVGESPLGWRIIGAVCGVIMLLVMYVFIKNMFGKTAVAACGTLLLGFDFMRYVQTRIATIDTYAVLFILLAFFFMYRYITTDADATFRKSLLPLALSGLFFGISFAVKWIGFYAGAGLLILYIIRLYQLWDHYNSTGKTGFGIYLIKTLLYSMLFFVVIPVIIYYITYIPYGTLRGMTVSGGMLWNPDYFRLVWQNQEAMLTYHSKTVLGAEHPFSSFWWQWIFNIKPILYVAGVSGDLRASFGAFGNPVIWWGGIPAVLVMAVRVFTHRDGRALFILIGYLTQLLPWIAVSRIVFVYHYFPSTLFIVLAFAHMFNTLAERRKRSGLNAVYGYTAASGSVFALFFPLLSGMYMPNWYYTNLVKWLYIWPF